MRALANYPRLRKIAGWFSVNWRHLKEQATLGMTLAVLLLVGAYLFGCPSMSAGELKIRIAGMALQVGGVTTVWWGMEKTRKLFHYDYSFVAFWKWIRQWPWRGPRPIKGNIAVTLDPATLTMEGQDVELTLSGATLEQRIAALERKAAATNLRLTEFEARLVQATNEQREALKRESAERERQTTEVAALLRAAQTGGLNVTIAGAVWLIVGIVFTSVPTDLAALWKLD